MTGSSVHLIYLHQGHAAFPSCLTAVAAEMQVILDGESYIAQANPWPSSTMNGIDKAVDRCVVELTELLHTRPIIRKLSLVGVSLGGVILERVMQRMYDSVLFPEEQVEFLYFIAIASPLNGITVGWNFPTLVASLIGSINPTLSDLVDMHDKKRDSVRGIALFKTRICLGNLYNDWRVPMTSSMPVGGAWITKTGTQRLIQQAQDESICVWNAVVLDLRDRWRVHHAITTDHRSMNAIREIIAENREDRITTL